MSQFYQSDEAIPRRVVIPLAYARSRFFDPVPADLTTFFEEVQLGRQPIDHQQCRMLWNRPFAGTGRAVACQLKRFEVAQAAERPHMIFTFDVSVNRPGF
ncbi:hypothetical protein VNPA141709_61010 [Pseudomonas aeruginosa]|nr:hypothetical protein VNPA141709_61010 [Pseudomonas aeruginosa]